VLDNRRPLGRHSLAIRINSSSVMCFIIPFRLRVPALLFRRRARAHAAIFAPLENTVFFVALELDFNTSAISLDPAAFPMPHHESCSLRLGESCKRLFHLLSQLDALRQPFRRWRLIFDAI